MQRIIRDYIETAELASSPDQLHDAVAHVTHLFDFNAFAFLALPGGKPPILISNYNDKWSASIYNFAFATAYLSIFAAITAPSLRSMVATASTIPERKTWA